MAKRRIERVVDFENRVVTFNVIGTDNSLVAKYDDLSDEMKVRAALHGINGKVGDSAADPTVDAFTVMNETFTNVLAGNWNVRGGGAGSRITVLAEALAEVTGQDLDTVVDKLEAMSVEERRAIPSKYAKVKAAVDSIKAARAAAKAKTSKSAAKGTDDGDLAELLI